MKKLFLLLSFAGFFSCQPNDPPNDVAARASGDYTIQYYIVNGDTLYSANGINKVDVRDFYIEVDRKSSDSVRIGIFYTRAGFGPIVAIKDVGVGETNSGFQFSRRTDALSTYEGKIDNNVFYERATGSAVSVWLVDSSKYPTYSPAKGVTILATKK